MFTKNFLIKKNFGFTLIELLVVVAIIGLLSSVVLTSLNSAKAKSRDTRRMTDLRQVQTALELYYSTNGSYPSTGSNYWGICSGYNPGGKTNSGANGYIANLAPTYIPVLPTETFPPPSGTGNCYLYNSNGTDYVFMAHNTIETFDPDVGPHSMDRRCCDQQSIAVYNRPDSVVQ